MGWKRFYVEGDWEKRSLGWVTGRKRENRGEREGAGNKEIEERGVSIEEREKKWGERLTAFFFSLTHVTFIVKIWLGSD